MRKLIWMIAAAAALLVSCNKEASLPTAEFGQNFYTVYARSTTDVTVSLSSPAASEVNVPIIASGDAVKGTDFTLSSDYAVFAAGEKETVITVTDLGLTADKSVTLTLGAGSGYQIGTKYVTIVSLDEKESLIYSFKTADAVLLESYVVTLSLSGTTSGDDFKATEDLTIPLTLSGDGASALSVGSVTVKAGESEGTGTISLKDAGFSGNTVAVVTVDPEAARYLPGETSSVLLQVRGLQTPDKLLGSWTFDKVYDLEEMELWFAEMEDDPEALPTHNNGFTLTFAKEGGDVVVTPSGEGDFNHFFRKSKVSLAEPVNMVAGGIKLGKYSTEEGNMFISEEAETYQQNTYYLLETANLAFSPLSEELGSAHIVFRITPDGDLCTEFREYKNADEFGMMWWDGGTKFDPDMFGFASLFKKTK